MVKVSRSVDHAGTLFEETLTPIWISEIALPIAEPSAAVSVSLTSKIPLDTSLDCTVVFIAHQGLVVTVISPSVIFPGALKESTIFS